MKKTRRIIRRVCIIILLIAAGVFCYFKFFNKKDLEIKEWDNIYNEANITMFYVPDDICEKSPNIKALNKSYNIRNTVAGAGDELKQVLKGMEIVNTLAEYDDVADCKSLNGNGILQEKGVGKKFSGRDMAYIARDVLIASGYKARIGEFRKEAPQGEHNSSYYVVEYWSDKYDKWVMVDYRDEGYFEKNDKPLSAIEIIEERIGDLTYVGNDTQKEYRKKLNDYLSSYTIAIDNTLPMEHSNSYITYIKSNKDIDLMKGNEYISPTIFTQSKTLFEVSPSGTEIGKDSKAYILMMKKTEKDGKNNTFVVGAFKNGAIVPKSYIKINDGQFEAIDKYKDVDLEKGKITIEISEDGVTTESKVIIENNK